MRTARRSPRAWSSLRYKWAGGVLREWRTTPPSEDAIDAHLPAPKVTVNMGRHSYAHPQLITFPGDVGSLEIGNFCSINGEVKVFVGGEHLSHWVTTFPLRIKLDLPGAYEDGCPASKGDVTIGHDVWIGYDSLILSGVTIGTGAIVGARSVVTKDVPPYSVTAGNPARHLRWRFGEAERDALLRVAWWHWPDSEIIERAQELNGSSVEDFLLHHDEVYRQSRETPAP